MNSHKKLILASLAICTAVVGTVGVAAMSNSNGLQAVNIVKADIPLYTLVIDCKNDIESVNSDFVVNTTSGNPLTFNVNNANNCFTKVDEGLQFMGNKGGIISNKSEFQSLYSIRIDTKDNGYEYNNIQVLGRNSLDDFAAFTPITAGQEKLFSQLDGNKYFSISAATLMGSNIITSITLKYNCSPTE